MGRADGSRRRSSARSAYQLSLCGPRGSGVLTRCSISALVRRWWSTMTTSVVSIACVRRRTSSDRASILTFWSRINCRKARNCSSVYLHGGADRKGWQCLSTVSTVATTAHHNLKSLYSLAVNQQLPTDRSLRSRVLSMVLRRKLDPAVRCDFISATSAPVYPSMIWSFARLPLFVEGS